MCKKHFVSSVVMMFLTVGVIFCGQTEARVSHADVFTFQNPDGTPIPMGEREVVGSARLKRTEHGIGIEVHTSALGPGVAYTNWWVIFNNPEACNDDGCGSDDFGNPDVEASVLYATGRVADEDGNSTYRAFLPVGLNRLNRTVEGRERQRFGPSLQNTWKAEIHYLIRCHGPASVIASELLEQISTVNGLCDVNDCFDAQAIVFPLPRGHRNR